MAKYNIDDFQNALIILKTYIEESEAEFANDQNEKVILSQQVGELKKQHGDLSSAILALGKEKEATQEAILKKQQEIDKMIDDANAKLANDQQKLIDQKAEDVAKLDMRSQDLDDRETELSNLEKGLDQRKNGIINDEAIIEKRTGELNMRESELDVAQKKLEAKEQALDGQEAELNACRKTLEQDTIKARAELDAKADEIAKAKKELDKQMVNKDKLFADAKKREKEANEQIMATKNERQALTTWHNQLKTKELQLNDLAKVIESRRQ